MSIDSLRVLLVGADTSLAERMRLRRWEFIRKRLPELSEMKVLDLGGSMRFWLSAPVRPRHITVVNLDPSEEAEAPWLTVLTGDACHADRLVAGQRLYLVFSNSLIEHVGGHKNRSALSHLGRSLAPPYFLQTPYRHFSA